jgi:hypothetical protein
MITSELLRQISIKLLLPGASLDQNDSDIPIESTRSILFYPDEYETKKFSHQLQLPPLNNR